MTHAHTWAVGLGTPRFQKMTRILENFTDHARNFRTGSGGTSHKFKSRRHALVPEKQTILRKFY